MCDLLFLLTGGSEEYYHQSSQCWNNDVVFWKFNSNVRRNRDLCFLSGHFSLCIRITLTCMMMMINTCELMLKVETLYYCMDEKSVSIHTFMWILEREWDMHTKRCLDVSWKRIWITDVVSQRLIEFHVLNPKYHYILVKSCERYWVRWEQDYAVFSIENVK